MKHSKKVLTASIALLLGVSGAAFGLLFSGNLLENPGFEVEDLITAVEADADGWTQMGAARTAATGHNTPAWSMYMTSYFDDQQQVDVFSGSAYQMEMVEDCSPYGLGMFEASGWHNTTESMASLSVDFDGLMPVVPGSFDGSTDGYEWMSIGGNIPPFAMMAKFMVSGAGDGVPADVHWDDVEFSTDCVYDYAKVSGKLGKGNRGNDGQNGKYSFSGAIGTLESEACGDANPVGMLHINYKSAGYSCDFTPTAPIGYDEVEGTATLAVSFLCEIADDDDLVGDATIVLTQGEGGYNGKGNTKDRGMISVDADNDDLDIEAANLDKGNVNLMQPEACPEV